MQTIVIIGGGFAGLTLVRHLDKSKFRVRLIDRDNFHAFPPLYYQVASSTLDPSDITFPLRRELRKLKNTTYHLGHVKEINIEAGTVRTSYETLHFDRLVIAAGTRNNYFGMDHLAETTFGIKSVGQASHTRDEILDRLERGAICTDPERRRQLLSFTVVGGGPAGVEIAGALGEIKKYVIPREYPELSSSDMNITLLEGSGRLLHTMSENASEKALRGLTDLMVDVSLNTSLKAYKDKIITLADGSEFYCETLIWTAGVIAEPMPGLPSEILGSGNRIIVDSYNRVTGHEDRLYAIGDIALMPTPLFPRGLPQLARPAIDQAKVLARNLNAATFRIPFRYRDKGSMATIGKHKAVADIGPLRFSGLAAWFAWLMVHLVTLMGMRNKINVMLNWIWNYMTCNSSLRLLLRPVKYPLRRHWGD